MILQKIYACIFTPILLVGCLPNPHKSNELSYKIKSDNASPTLKTVEFKFRYSDKYEFLEVRTTYPSVKFEDINGDGTKDIIVTSETFEKYKVEILVFIAGVNKLELKVCKNIGMGVNYPRQGLVSP